MGWNLTKYQETFRLKEQNLLLYTCTTNMDDALYLFQLICYMYLEPKQNDVESTFIYTSYTPLSDSSFKNSKLCPGF